MSIIESIRTAFAGIFGNKMRALLTMFGIIVGISSVIMIMSVGDGVKASINNQFAALGIDVVSLYVESETEPIEIGDYITNSDIEVLKQYEDIVAISPIVSLYAPEAIGILGRNETKDVSIRGVSEDYLETDGRLKLARGRFLLPQDIENEAETVIIEEDFARDVIGNVDCIGSRIKLNIYGESQTLTVIGVLESDDGSALNALYNRPATVYIPNPLAQKLSYASNPIYTVRMKVADVTRSKAISDNIIRLMEMNHGNQDKYVVYANSDDIAEVNLVVDIFTIFLTLVAGISLLVGGIGVMNIMLVAVTERTKEIGIRKSLGATETNIRIQFLIEAIVITGIGAVIGMLFGYVTGMLLAQLATMAMGVTITASISMNAILAVAGISAFIGIVFGVYPAVKASGLDPIEALRFE